MGSADSFLNKLVNYDKEHISQEIVKAVQPYLVDPDFSPEVVISKSSAAAGMYCLSLHSIYVPQIIKLKRIIIFF